jgi:hypothetical protein
VIKIKKPILRIRKNGLFNHGHQRFTSFTRRSFVQQTLQAGLLTVGSSYLLHLPLAKKQRVAFATFVTGYSGGTVPFTPKFLTQGIVY